MQQLQVLIHRRGDFVATVVPVLAPISMQRNLVLVVSVLVASTLVQCGHDAMVHPESASDANADTGSGGTCCTPPKQTFTTLAEGDIPMNFTTSEMRFTTPAVDVSAYREVVLGFSSTGGGCLIDADDVLFEEAGSSVFVYTGQLTTGGRIRVDGPTMQTRFRAVNSGISNCNGNLHYIILGVSP
jgi:hypothetical protein